MNELRQFSSTQQDSIKAYVRDEINRNKSVQSTKSIITSDFKMVGMDVFIDGEKIPNVRDIRAGAIGSHTMIIDKMMLRDGAKDNTDILIIGNDFVTERLIVTVEASNG